VDEEIPQYLQFKKTMTKGSVRLAKSFLEWEKNDGFCSTDEDLSKDEENMVESLNLKLRRVAVKSDKPTNQVIFIPHH
jgi:hypothetical protein